MSAETLRAAAAKMREQHGPEHERHEMWTALAAWLDACALVTEVAPDRHKGNALAVATAYLGAEVPA